MMIFSRITCAIILVIFIAIFTPLTCYSADKYDSSGNIPSSAYGDLAMPTTTLHSGPSIITSGEIKVIPDNFLNRPLVISTAIVQSNSTKTSSLLAAPVASDTSFVPPAIVTLPGTSE